MSPAIDYPTETEFQGQVIELAHLLGWEHLHVRRSIGKGSRWVTATNKKGWPDLYLWHPTFGGSFTAELKIPPNTTTPEQDEVLHTLAASGVPSFVWTPDDWPEIKSTLELPRRNHAQDPDRCWCAAHRGNSTGLSR